MKTFSEFLNESVLRYTWKAVSPEDIDTYLKKNNIKMKKDKDMYVGVKNGKVVFRYSLEDEMLYSDYTIIELEDGRVK